MSWSRWGALAAVAVAAMFVGLAWGALPFGSGDFLGALTGAATPAATILRELRLPRVLMGFLVGGSLAVSGAVLQAMIRNPLADPYLLGISGGAGLAAVLVIALGHAGGWSLTAAAFAGALAAMITVYRVSLVGGRRLDPQVLLLSGVVVSAFATALVAAVLTLAPADTVRSAYLWTLGGLSASSWPALAVVAVYSLPALGVIGHQARGFDLLVLGDEQARYLGIDPDRLRRVAYVATGLLTAASVAACGMIGFVGLVVPHAIRRLWGPLHRALLPAAFLAGGAVLVLADALARSIAPPLELPVGVVTALIGVPVFVSLLRKTAR
jgi:iron complex transport system permease protein